MYQLIYRYRGQAPSHKSEAQQKARLIIDQPGFFYCLKITYFFKP